jgi:hypothetical protein
LPRSPEGWLNPGWNWFSIPLDPGDSAEASGVLGFDCANILYRWNAIGKSFELCPNDFTDLERGRGYLLRLATDQRPYYIGDPATGDFEIPLPEAGWTWIGQPFNHDTLIETCRIRNNTLGLTRSAAEDSNAPDAWLNWNWLWWDSTLDSWKLAGLQLVDDTALHPWYGYLVWANTRDLTLIVPSD